MGHRFTKEQIEKAQQDLLEIYSQLTSSKRNGNNYERMKNVMYVLQDCQESAPSNEEPKRLPYQQAAKTQAPQRRKAAETQIFPFKSTVKFLDENCNKEMPTGLAEVVGASVGIRFLMEEYPEMAKHSLQRTRQVDMVDPDTCIWYLLRSRNYLCIAAQRELCAHVQPEMALPSETEKPGDQQKQLFAEGVGSDK